MASELKTFSSVFGYFVPLLIKFWLKTNHSCSKFLTGDLFEVTCGLLRKFGGEIWSDNILSVISTPTALVSGCWAVEEQVSVYQATFDCKDLTILHPC